MNKKVEKQNNKQELKQKLSKLNFFSKLSEWQKVTAVIILGVFISGFAFFGYAYSTDPTFRNNFNGYTTGQTIVTRERDQFIRSEVDKISAILGQFDKTQDYYKEYSFADLDIYPQSYKTRIFVGSELNNELVSGANADPDNDGLINKLEFFYGSHPKKARSLCEGKDLGAKPYKTSPFVCDSKNDKELVDTFTSPLTGLDLDTADKFRVLNQDVNIINNMKKSFEEAARDGVDLPVLYQEALLLDFENELDAYNVRELEDNAKNILEYRNFRFDILSVLIGESQISTISQIYTATQSEQFESLNIQYRKVLDKVKKVAAPKAYVKTHKLYIMLFEKLIKFVDHRKSGLENKTFENSDFKEASKKISLEITWVYRRIKEEGQNADKQFN